MRRSIFFLVFVLGVWLAQYTAAEQYYKGMPNKSTIKPTPPAPLMAAGLTAPSASDDLISHGVESLPCFSQYKMKAAADEAGNVFLLAHEGLSLKLVNVKTKETYYIPEGNLMWGFLHTGLAIGDGRVHVAWTSDGYTIRYTSMNLVTKEWAPVEHPVKDMSPPWNGQPTPDTQSCALAVNKGRVMIMTSSDQKLKAHFKNPGEGHWTEQEIAPYDWNEPGPGMLVPYGNGFIASYIMGCNQGINCGPRSIAISRWDGEWVRESCLPINNCPSCVSTVKGSDGRLYLSWHEWCNGPPENFCTFGFAEQVNNQWQLEWPWQQDFLSNIEHPPDSGVAVDDKGNVILTQFRYTNSDTSTHMQYRKKGQGWSQRVKKGDGSLITCVYSKLDQMFYLIYIQAGTMKVERLSFGAVVQPSPTPTPTVDPNKPTPTPVPITGEVPQYDIYEIKLTTNKSYGNPFADVTVTGTFYDPAGGSVRMKGFYDGDRTWIVRYRPDSRGVHRYDIGSSPANSDLTGKGAIQALPSRPGNHGPMYRDGPFLTHADGSDHYHIGATAFGLLWDKNDPQDPIGWLNRYLAKGINYYRIANNIYWGTGCWAADGTGWEGCCGEAWANGCWLGTCAWETFPFPADPTYRASHGHPPMDFTKFSLEHFRRLDAVMKHLLKNNAYAEIVFMGNGYGYLDDQWVANDPKIAPMLDYFIARTAAYPNMIFEVANEPRHGCEPEACYKKSMDWANWIMSRVKSSARWIPVAYDAQWVDDPAWLPDPEYHAEWKYYPGVSHRHAWESPNCDIINWHSDRTPGVWWWLAPKQGNILADVLKKPISNDEPHRANYIGEIQPLEIIKSAWLTTFVNGSSYYTIHGVSNAWPNMEWCRACVLDEDIPNDFSIHYSAFWQSVGKFGMNIDNSLIEGNGQHKRAMQKDGHFAYMALDAQSTFKFKVLEDRKYEFGVMDIETGEWILREVKSGSEFSVTLPKMMNMAAYLKPYTVPPTPTPTLTPVPTSTPPPVEATPTPTKKPGGGWMGCGKRVEASAGAAGPEESVGSMLLGMICGILVIYVVNAARRRYHGKN